MVMKALILAAGLGLRLAPLTNDIPKALVKVCGKPIIINQIEALSNNGITDITVISGYKSEMLESCIHSYFDFVNIVKNTDYKKTNNMYSAYLGREAMLDSDFIMMNADVFFDNSVLSKLVEKEHADSIIVDIGKYNEESMKVVVDENKITKISKTIPKEEAYGNSIDVYKFSKKSGKLFFEKCFEYIDNNILDKWSEFAINDILSITNFTVCPLNGRWYEIDNHNDLKEANILFQSGGDIGFC